MTRKIQAVLWDKDGTLLDGLAPWILRERAFIRKLARRFSQKNLEPQTLKVMVSQGLQTLGWKDNRLDPRGLLAHGTEKTIILALGEVLKTFGCVIPEERFLEQALGELSTVINEIPLIPKPMPGAQKALETFKSQGLIQGLVTSDSLAHTQDELTQLQWHHFFTMVSCGDQVSHPKPHPEPIISFVREHRIPPKEILFIGDSPADWEMAAQAGAEFLGVLTGAGTPEDFPEPCPVIPTLERIIDQIKGFGVRYP